MLQQSNFIISGIDNKFTLIKFHGVEALSTAYTFELEVSTNKLIEHPDRLLWQSCEFTMCHTRERTIGGMVTQVEVIKKVDELYFYKLIVRPTLWGLSEEVGCEVFLDMSVIDVISQVLAKPRNGLQIPFELKTNEDYEPREITVQFNQSSFDFINVLMESYGLYYYFEHKDGTEKLIITDNKVVHQKLAAEDYRYYLPTGLDLIDQDNLISEFKIQCRARAKNVLLKNYNYQKPDVEVEGISSIDDKGVGQQYYYGDQFSSRKEGNLLAKLKSEQLKAKTNLCFAKASDPQMMPGCTFALTDYFIDSANQDYLVVAITHQGHTGSAENELSYSNEFECLSTNLQYRSQEKTPKIKIHGVINGTIDASGEEDLDFQGRYKVLFNFDLSNPDAGKASHRMRLLTPYSDSAGGMHFPLREGTEVKIAFEHGDPSRPVIVGAVPNPNTPSVVNDLNSTSHVIKSSSGSQISMSDGASSSTILISSDDQNSFIRITK